MPDYFWWWYQVRYRQLLFLDSGGGGCYYFSLDHRAWTHLGYVFHSRCPVWWPEHLVMPDKLRRYISVLDWPRCNWCIAIRWSSRWAIYLCTILPASLLLHLDQYGRWSALVVNDCGLFTASTTIICCRNNNCYIELAIEWIPLIIVVIIGIFVKILIFCDERINKPTDGRIDGGFVKSGVEFFVKIGRVRWMQTLFLSLLFIWQQCAKCTNNLERR